ncbi:hypothetical protein MKZ38_007362 [Zalerion maritima]|uniref:Dihydrodipicolinate synthase n=1 Tax=Zalerion maritima TaxID=339359 RepID=A0AAD5RVR2_9PEZI|nr:hypothetical protein MKZ38_007362 [Zalerion maritima]
MPHSVHSVDETMTGPALTSAGLATPPNMEAMPSARPLPQGVYVPTIAFFDHEDEIDIQATQAHAIRLANSGAAGIVVHGSNGEAVHLSNQERSLVIAATRAALQTEIEHSVPLVAGCGAQSTKETVSLCKDAHKAGATHALVLPPAYYASLVGRRGFVDHFKTVADASPIPILIYNFPGAANGVDLTSDEILELSKHPNICGVKLTCGNTGKLARIAAEAPEDFFVAGGSADFILQGQVVGGHGTISGLANICPKACVRIMTLFDQGKLKEARQLQAVVARADWIAIQTGFVGVKAALQEFFGYGGTPRLPCTQLEGDALEKIRKGFAEAVEVEETL